MFVFRVIFSISILSQISQAITVCPVTEVVSTASSGARYSTCPNTDLQGSSAQVISNVATLAACVQQCDNSGACLQAVYDKTNKVCHIKAQGVTFTWVTNDQFDVIRLRNIVPEAENIARCPYPETTSTSNGKTYNICQGSDLRGTNAQTVSVITTPAACAQRCSTTTGCVQAVFDRVSSICYIKSDATANTQIWIMTKRYTTIQQNIPINPSTLGRWTDLIRFPVIPVAGYVVPATPEPSRLLMFSSWGVDAFGGASGRTQFVDYNFKTGATSQLEVANTQHDMFCPGISALEDGRILISGGSDAAAVSFYNPSTNTFTKGPDMKIPRGYQTSVTTSEGKVFELGGSYSGARGGKTGEIYNVTTNTWAILTNAKTDTMLTVDNEGIWRTDNHAWLFAWKNGYVFQAGPSKAQNWFGTTGSGSVTAAGVRDGGDAMCGVNVMYDVGKILSTGGSQDYTNSPGVARTHITTIDVPNTPSIIERVADMKYPRGFANGVVLPDGTTLVTGGQRRSLVFTDTDGILYPELFDPVTKTWKVLAPEAVPRNYHAISILLPDATVFSGGGGLCYVGTIGGSSANCNKAVDHADGQIFSPPYLFNAGGSLAPRPVISSLSAASVRVGGSLTVSFSSGVTSRLVLVRMGSVTHSINSDQRRIPLSNVAVSGNSATVTLPNDSGILIVGHYYLFAISSSGVPSVARTLRVTLV